MTIKSWAVAKEFSQGVSKGGSPWLWLLSALIYLIIKRRCWASLGTQLLEEDTKYTKHTKIPSSPHHYPPAPERRVARLGTIMHEDATAAIRSFSVSLQASPCWFWRRRCWQDAAGDSSLYELKDGDPLRHAISCLHFSTRSAISQLICNYLHNT